MDYGELIAKVIEWLPRDKRVACRALKRRFDLDDDCLDDLKIDVIEARRRKRSSSRISAINASSRPKR